MLSVLVGAVTLGSLTYAPLVLRSLHSLDATSSGGLLVPMLASAGVGTTAAGRLAVHGWTRPTCWLLMMVGLPAVAGPSLVLAVIGLAAAALGAGAAFPLLLLDAQDAVAQDQLAQASSVVQLGRNVGAAAGVLGLGLWLGAGLSTGTALLGILVTMRAAAAAGPVTSLGREERS